MNSSSNPFYIIAPRYTQTSAGVRVLYKICDLINKNGYSAYIFLRPHIKLGLIFPDNFTAPILTAEIRDYHFNNGLTPIVIYPETFSISKFNAPFRVPYFLNYPELLSQKKASKDDNYILSYSMNISKKIMSTLPGKVIFLPVSDHNFFIPPSKNKNSMRSGSVFYAGKYKYHFNGTLFDITKNSIEITRDQPFSQSREQIRKLFQEADLFFCYEDSALALEAILCECPVVFLPNKHFKECLGSHELNGLGFAWGLSNKKIQHARKTVKIARARYIKLLKESNSSVKSFADEVQLLVKAIKYNKPFADDYLKNKFSFFFFGGYTRFFIEYIQDHGFRKFFKTLFKRIKFRRFKL